MSAKIKGNPSKREYLIMAVKDINFNITSFIQLRKSYWPIRLN